MSDHEDTPEIKTATPTPPASKKGGCLGKGLKIVGGIFVVLFLFGLIVDTFTEKKDKQPAQSVQQATQATPQPAPAKEIKKDKEFPFTKAQVITAYDDVMQQLAGIKPLGAAKEERGNSKYSDNRSYMLTPNAAVMLLMNLGGENPYEVKAIAVEDGTAETRALAVLNAMSLMAAVTPGWTGDERGAVGKALGITGRFPNLGETKTTSAKGINFSFANNGERGLTLSIRPE